jgi:hypothetical protein
LTPIARRQPRRTTTASSSSGVLLTPTAFRPFALPAAASMRFSSIFGKRAFSSSAATISR